MTQEYAYKFRTTIKRWGDDLVVIIPDEIVKQAGIKEGQRVVINIEKVAK